MLLLLNCFTLPLDVAKKFFLWKNICLAALSSSRSLVVCLSVGRSVDSVKAVIVNKLWWRKKLSDEEKKCDANFWDENHFEMKHFLWLKEVSDENLVWDEKNLVMKKIVWCKQNSNKKWGWHICFNKKVLVMTFFCMVKKN